MTPKAGMVQLDTDHFRGVYFTGDVWIGFTYARVLLTSRGVSVVLLN